MSTPTKEQTLRVLYLYIGAEYRIPGAIKLRPGNHKVSISTLRDIESDMLLPSEFKLLLRDISSLTDEECKEIARLAGNNEYKDFSIERGIGFINVVTQSRSYYISILEDGDIFIYNNRGATSPCNQSQIQQYLFKLGINLPLYELGGLTPVEAKIAIKKEVKS